MMHYKVLKNGNIEIHGKEYIPRERIENTIDKAVVYRNRKLVLNTILFIVAMLISFIVGYVIG